MNILSVNYTGKLANGAARHTHTTLTKAQAYQLMLLFACFSFFLPACLSRPLSFPSFLSHLKSIKNRATFFFFLINISGTSMVVQRLRLCAPDAGGPGFGPGFRSHMLQLRVCIAAMKIKDSACCN